MENSKAEVEMATQGIVDDFKLAMLKAGAYQNANLTGLDDELQAYLNARDVVSSGE